MFPVDIIASLIKTILGDVGKDIIGKGRDPKRRFARDLFRVYDAAKEYRSWCAFLLKMLERERRLEPDKRMSASTAYEAQKVSDDLVELVRVMMGTFQSDLLRNLEKPRRSSDDAASKKFKVLAIYDAHLATLLERAMAIDMGIAYIAGAMSQQKFDEKTQDILFLDPTSADDVSAVIDCIDDFKDGKGRASFIGGDRYDLEKRQIAKFFRRANFTKDEDFAMFAELLRRSMAVIDEFTASMASFIKKNYAMDELL
jgi:hypothetical protein